MILLWQGSQPMHDWSIEAGLSLFALIDQPVGAGELHRQSEPRSSSLNLTSERRHVWWKPASLFPDAVSSAEEWTRRYEF